MTHPLMGPVALAAVALFLSGCGDFIDDLTGSGSSSSAADEIIDVTTAGGAYDDQIIQSLDLMFALEGSSITPSDQIPTSDTASYSGVVGFSNDSPAQNVAEYDMMSDLSINADFASGEISGTFDNFNTRDDVALNGSLTLTEGQVAGTGFTANAIGAFTDGTNAEIWDLEVVADFVGAGGAGIVGTANGTISNGGSDTSDVFGDLIAQQD